MCRTFVRRRQPLNWFRNYLILWLDNIFKAKKVTENDFKMIFSSRLQYYDKSILPTWQIFTSAKCEWTMNKVNLNLQSRIISLHLKSKFSSPNILEIGEQFVRYKSLFYNYWSSAVIILCVNKIKLIISNSKFRYRKSCAYYFFKTRFDSVDKYFVYE